MTTIHAQGTSEAFYTAERATITISVSVTSASRAHSIETATALHNRIVARAVALRESNDATWHSADPIHTYAFKTLRKGSKSQVDIEHRTASTVRVKLQNLELVSDLVTEMAYEGVTTNVDWTLTEEFRKRVEKDARRDAVHQARAVADDYAEALGETIDHVVSISDVVGGDTADFRPRTMMRAQAFSTESAEVTIPEITVSATVTGVFDTAA
ncbi:MAG: SIMPL domain-containing protein [Microbacterium sp.]